MNGYDFLSYGAPDAFAVGGGLAVFSTVPKRAGEHYNKAGLSGHALKYATDADIHKNCG